MEDQITHNIEVFKNLQIGHKYKYVDLCDILGESRLQGKQKEYQISRWERKCNLKKIDGSPYYEVVEIYEREIRPPETRGKKNDYCVILLPKEKHATKGRRERLLSF